MRIVDCNLANILQRAPLVLFAGAGFYCALFLANLLYNLYHASVLSYVAKKLVYNIMYEVSVFCIV